MFIADAQVHVWAPNTPERPWAPGNVHREVPLEAAQVLRAMDAAGVHRTVLVPPSLDADRNDLSLAAAQKHPDRFAVMGRLDPDAPGARSAVAEWRRQPGMRGLRYSLNRPKWIPISVSPVASLPPARFRCLRPETHVLGHGLLAAAVFLP